MPDSTIGMLRLSSDLVGSGDLKNSVVVGDRGPRHDPQIPMQPPDRGPDQPRTLAGAPVVAERGAGVPGTDERGVDAQHGGGAAERPVLDATQIGDHTDSGTLVIADLAADEVTRSHGDSPGSG
jgi:hypothetical protein